MRLDEGVQLALARSRRALQLDVQGVDVDVHLELVGRRRSRHLQLHDEKVVVLVEDGRHHLRYGLGYGQLPEFFGLGERIRDGLPIAEFYYPTLTQVREQHGPV